MIAITAMMATTGVSLAIEPPPELRYICIDQQRDVYQAVAPSACTSREIVLTVPDNRPVHLCADHLGRLKYATRPSDCGTREILLTIPDSGPLFVCSRNIQGGVVLPRGKLRHVGDVSKCDRDETAFVTPAAPVAYDDRYTVAEDVLLEVPPRGVLDNDRDLTGEPLTARLVTETARGAVRLGSDGAFSFDPRGSFDFLDEGESDQTSFTYIANDGALESAPASAVLVVRGANDRPQAGVDLYMTDEDSVLERGPGQGVLSNDSDAEGHPLTARLLTGPEKGRLALGSDGNFVFDPTAAFQGLDEGESTAARFVYVANDGTTDSDATDVTVSIAGRNDAPVGVPDRFTVRENARLVIDEAALVANDTDVDGESLEVASVNLRGGPHPAPEGTLTAAGGQVTFDPTIAFDGLESDETATVTFSYRAGDGSVQTSEATPVTIGVLGQSPPRAMDDSNVVTDEDTAITVDFVANDAPAGAKVSTITSPTVSGDPAAPGGAVSQTAHEGVVVYDPRGAFDGLPENGSRNATFAYTLRLDPQPGDVTTEPDSTATVTVGVQGRNDAPVAVADNYSTSTTQAQTFGKDEMGDRRVLANDTDVDTPHDALTAVLVSPPQLGRLALEADGTFTYDPAGEIPADGADVTFSYRARDGRAESSTAVVTLHVGTNDAPVVTGPTSFRILTTDDDGIVGTTTANDPDGDDGALKFGLIGPDAEGFRVDDVTDPATGATVGRISLRGPPTTGRYHPTLTVTDAGNATTTVLLTIDIDEPLLPGQDVYRGVGNTELIAGAGGDAPAIAVRVPDGVLANDGGVIGEDVVVEAVEGAPTEQGGTYSIRADGTFRYMPRRPEAGRPFDPEDCSEAREAAPSETAAEFFDCFRYTLVRNKGTEHEERERAWVLIAVDRIVWYVDSKLADGTGTSADPYGSLAALSPEDPTLDHDEPGDVVFVLGKDRSPYPAGIALEERQELIGEAHGLEVRGIVVAPPLSGAEPVVAPTSGAAVALARDNVVQAVKVEAAGTAAGVVGASVGKLLLRSPSVKSAGATALALRRGDVDVAIGTVAASDETVGVWLDHLTGRVAIDGLSATHTGDGSGGTTTDCAAGAEPAGALVVSCTKAAVSVAGATVTGATGAVIQAADGVGVTIGQLTGSGVAGPALSVLDNRAPVSVSALTAHDAGTAVAVENNLGDVTIGTLAATDVRRHGLLVSDNSGTVRVIGGTLGAAPASDSAVAVFGGSGRLDVGAGVTVPVGAAARSVEVTGLAADSGGEACAVVGKRAGCVRFSGAISDNGGGVLLHENAPGTLVRFGGSLKASVTGAAALVARNTGLLEVTGFGNNLVATGASALHLDGVDVGPGGVTFHDVRSLPPWGAGSSTPGIHVEDVHGVDTGTGRSRLIILDGHVRSSPGAGVEVSSSSDITVGPVTVEESGGAGVALEETRGVVLDGTEVDLAGAAGISSSGDEDLLIDGARVVDSFREGLRVAEFDNSLSLRNTLIRGSLAAQVHVVDVAAAACRRDVLEVQGTGISDGPNDVPAVLVEAGGGGGGIANLALRLPADQPSILGGGSVALDVRARAGAQVDVALSGLAVAGASGDGVRLRAEGANVGVDPCPGDGQVAPPASKLAFLIDGMDEFNGGGIQTVGGAGLRLEDDGVGTVAGRAVRLDVSATDGPGIAMTGVKDVRLELVDVNGTQESGIVARDSKGLSLRRVEIEGNFAGHGLELRNSRGVTVTESRFDRLIPHPEGAVEEAPPQVAAIFGRHVDGITVSDTTVRRATHHQIFLVNGTRHAVLDPAEETADLTGLIPSGSARLVRLKVEESAPELRNETGQRVAPAREAVFVGAGAGGSLAVDLGGSTDPGGATTTTDAGLTFSADDGPDLPPFTSNPPAGGFTSVTGGPHIRKTHDGDVLTLHAQSDEVGVPGRVRFDFDGLHVDFVGGATGRALVIKEEGQGVVEGEAKKTTVSNARGAGFDISSKSGVTLTNPIVRNSTGPGIRVADSSAVTVTDATVENSGAEGVLVERSSGISFQRGMITRAGASGIRVQESERVTLTGLHVSQPARHGLEALAVTDLTVSGGDFDLAPPEGESAPPGPHSGIFARQLGGEVVVAQTTLRRATHHQLVLLNGSGIPGFDDPPLPSPSNAQLTLDGLTLVGSASDEFGALLSAGSGGELGVKLTGNDSKIDRQLRIESVGGTVAVTGGSSIVHSGSDDALVITAQDPSRLDVDLADVDVTHPAGAEGTGHAVVVDGAGKVSLRRIKVLNGIGILVVGSGVTPGGYVRIGGPVLEGEHDTTITGARRAVAVVGSDSVTISGVGIEAGGDGAVLFGNGDVNIADSSIAGTDSGLLAIDVRCLDAHRNDSTEVAEGALQYDLLDSNLKDFEPLFETVEEWLVERDNLFDFGSVRSSNVASC